MENILKIEDLHVSYGAIRALKGVDITVPKGNIVAILGSNGAGKTSLLKTISGLVPAAAGTITFEGNDITRLSVERIAKDGIAHAPEGRQIFSDLSVYENLKIGAFTLKPQSVPINSIYDNAKTKRLKEKIAASGDGKDDASVLLSADEMFRNNLERVYDLFPVLKERNRQIASTLSGGEMQMLAIGRALMASPKLLILDEPSLGLAPLIVRDIFNIIKELNNMGISVLIVEQNALQTLKIADYGYVIQVGKVVKEGKASSLIKDEELIEAYLGK